ncbi:MAG: hypothetical protein PHP53_11045 [Prolixibacteraceae bacterium]|nr:hypothetical protein [Prolixibacteraceae bacterium]
METNNNNKSVVTLETLIHNLRIEDNRNLTLTRTMQGVMWGVVTIYAIILVVKSIMGAPWPETIGGFVVMLAFVLFALFFRNYSKEYKSVDYGLPTTQMLSKAIQRYQIFQRRSIFLLIPLALEDLGLTLFMHDFFNGQHAITNLLIAHAYFIGLLAIGFFVGYLIWKKRHKPLRDYAIKLLKEIQS